MKVELVTCVMLQNAETNEVLVQNRTRKHLGWSFPGGHVERGESFYDCAIREVKEETGLDICNLEYCGVVHWVDRENDNRYLCFMYKTTEYSGELIAVCDEGEHFWLSRNDLFSTPKERFSSAAEHYALSPLFHEYGKYSEAFVPWSGEKSTWELYFN